MFLSHSCSLAPSTVLGPFDLFMKYLLNERQMQMEAREELKMKNYFTAKRMNFYALNLKYFIL